MARYQQMQHTFFNDCSATCINVNFAGIESGVLQPYEKFMKRDSVQIKQPSSPHHT